MFQRSSEGRTKLADCDRKRAIFLGCQKAKNRRRHMLPLKKQWQWKLLIKKARRCRRIEPKVKWNMFERDCNDYEAVFQLKDQGWVKLWSAFALTNIFPDKSRTYYLDSKWELVNKGILSYNTAMENHSRKAKL